PAWPGGEAKGGRPPFSAMSIASRTEAAQVSVWDSLQEGTRRAFGPSDRTPGRALPALAVATALSASGAIVMGGIVRTTGSGLRCDSANDNGWPLCQGRLLPPLEQTAVIEFIHRWMAATLSFLLVVLVATVLLRHRHNRVLVGAVVTVTVLTIAQIALGAVTV